MAGASAAVGRRKASALRSARAASDDAANSFAPFGALPPLIFLEANASWLWSTKLGYGRIARTRSLAPSAPAKAGEGDHWSSRSERAVVEGAPDSELRCWCR